MEEEEIDDGGGRGAVTAEKEVMRGACGGQRKRRREMAVTGKGEGADRWAARQGAVGKGGEREREGVGTADGVRGHGQTGGSGADRLILDLTPKVTVMGHGRTGVTRFVPMSLLIASVINGACNYEESVITYH